MNFLKAQSNLMKTVSHEIHDELICRLKAHEQGRSETYSRDEVKSLLKEHLNTIRNDSLLGSSRRR